VKRAPLLGVLVFTTALVLNPASAQAADILCDPSFENCRTRILELIRNERVGIDVAFWFMEDSRYSTELIRKWQEGVPVRVIVDPRGSNTNPLNADRLAELKAGGVPMRKRTDSNILHWKVMLFDGQNTVQFSAANYSAVAFVPDPPYQNYIDEVIYFADDPAIVNSFRTKYDDLWVNTTKYGNYANISGPLVRRYGQFPKDPELNFPPEESYRNRAVPRLDAETRAIDVTMYRITDRSYSDALIRAVQRGVPVRLLTEPDQYRDPTRYMHSWNIDRMYVAGVQIRHRAHGGLNHQKSAVLHSQAMTIWGSSNWTSVSTDSQQEHNYFTHKPNFYYYFTDQFERKWNNAAGFAETEPFAPLPPDSPVSVSPANGAFDTPTAAVVLTWQAGYWAHVYDIYFGTTSAPPLFRGDVTLGPSTSDADYRRFAITGLTPGTTYYWRIVSKTMAHLAAEGPIFSFTTAGTPPPPPPTDTAGPGDIILYASRAPVVQGAWRLAADASAAAGSRLGIPDAGTAKVAIASPDPADYFELTFNAEAGRAYRLWIRGRADNNHWANDSAHVQFSDTVDAAGQPVWRIGTSTSTEFSIENGTGAGLSGWGWQDNGYGTMGPLVYFVGTGAHTLRVQRREDGLWIDQIVLSPEKYLNTPPGAGKKDMTILSESDAPPPPPPQPVSEVVLYASEAAVTGTAWVVAEDSTAAGGALLVNPDAGQPKIETALASPSSYFELSFHAEANTGYRLWIRGRARNNSWANDSVFVQFSDSRSVSGAPTYRFGTTDAAWVGIEDCSGCGLAGWGWQDNAYGPDREGAGGPPLLYFDTGGVHTLRVQQREDGISIDQIVLSAGQYLNTSPGALKNDATILIRP
jgi:phosphatidylserine/phosphatidylglycerophosphate/cardiolipin synthase-like enzyme